jgi:hypothetical protein
MTDANHKDNQSSIMNFIENAKIAHPNPPQIFCASKFLGAMRKWVARQTVDGVSDALLIPARLLFDLADGGRRK